MLCYNILCCNILIICYNILCYNILCCNSITFLFQITEELLKTWTKMATTQEHVPLGMHMSAVVMKSVTRFAFGEYFKDEKALIAFRKDYDFVSDLYILDGSNCACFSYFLFFIRCQKFFFLKTHLEVDRNVNGCIMTA